MTKEDLEQVLRSWENMDLVIKHISDFPENMDVLMEIAFDDSQDINWRAMYLVEKIHEKYPNLILPYFPVMTDFMLITKKSGKKRHLLKLISLHDIPEEKMAILLNFCIDVFTNAAEDIAVRVHAMQILFNIAQKEPDFAGELIGLIEHEIEFHGSAGISSRGGKLLKKLYLMEQSSAIDEQLWNKLSKEEQIELLKIEQEVQSDVSLIDNEQMKAKHKKWL